MERLMVVPLRKARRGSSERFAPKAMKYLKAFVARHMKAEEVLVGSELNEFIWSKGARNPPRRVQVKSTKKEGKAYVEIASVSQEKWNVFIGGKKEEPKKKKKDKEKEPEKKKTTKKPKKKEAKKKPKKKAEKKPAKKKPAKKPAKKKTAAKKTPVKKVSTKTVQIKEKRTEKTKAKAKTESIKSTYGIVKDILHDKTGRSKNRSAIIALRNLELPLSKYLGRKIIVQIPNSNKQITGIISRIHGKITSKETNVIARFRKGLSPHTLQTRAQIL